MGHEILQHTDECSDFSETGKQRMGRRQLVLSAALKLGLTASALEILKEMEELRRARAWADEFAGSLQIPGTQVDYIPGDMYLDAALPALITPRDSWLTRYDSDPAVVRNPLVYTTPPVFDFGTGKQKIEQFLVRVDAMRGMVFSPLREDSLSLISFRYGPKLPNRPIELAHITSAKPSYQQGQLLYPAVIIGSTQYGKPVRLGSSS